MDMYQYMYGLIMDGRAKTNQNLVRLLGASSCGFLEGGNELPRVFFSKYIYSLTCEYSNGASVHIKCIEKFYGTMMV